MTAPEAARLSVTANSTVAPAPSSVSASATESPGGPCTDVAGSAFESATPSPVHIAPASAQSALGPRATAMSP